VLTPAEGDELITLVARLDELSDLSPLAGMLARPACGDRH
jgi:hypothetical protein